MHLMSTKPLPSSPPSRGLCAIWRICSVQEGILRNTVLGGILVLWCAGLAAGTIALWRYSATPGSTGAVPERWPANSLVQPRDGRATLVMLAHPRCPCTRASLAELAQLRAQGDVDAWVLFLRPEGGQSGWENTDLWRTAASIPGVRVVADADGVAARMFGAETSGHVLFYDAAGALRFSGGITAARGHVGPSAGGDAISAMLHGSEPPRDRALTFGCLLHSEESPQ
jgi:hypothetical protein